MKMSEYYRQREQEWLDLARQYERCAEDQQKAAGAKEAREQAEQYRAEAEAAEAEERAEETQTETESETQTESAEERTTNNMNMEGEPTMNDTIKNTTDFEIEIMRHNVTPAQFLAYVRSRVDAKGGKWYRSDLDLNWFKNGDDRWNCDYSFGLPGEKGAAAERSVDKPFEKQTYIMHFDGSVYNEIVEFDFWDEKTGFGYYYLVNKTAAPEDADHNARLHYESVKRYNEREIERTERKIAEKREYIEREGEWLRPYWVEQEKRNISYLEMEIANRRDNIAECDELLGIEKGEQNMKKTIKFEIGKKYTASGLYTGYRTLECIARDEETVTFREHWVSEDSGKLCSAECGFGIETADILKGYAQTERVELWEYRGVKGYMEAVSDDEYDRLREEAEAQNSADTLPGYDPDLDTLHDEMVEAGEIEEEDFEREIPEEELEAALAEEAEREITAEQIIETIEQNVEQTKTRSAWDRGVKAYAEELVEELREAVGGGYVDADELSNRRLLEKAMLNGAEDWKQYSEGGCAFCYDWQIAKRLCAPWELRKTDNGRKDPNPRETWIDVQSRALYQAAQLVLGAAF